MMDKNEITKNKLEILNLLSNVKRKGIENLVSWFNESDFFVAPASTMFHGNYEGGLAAHSYEVYKEFKKKIENYSLNVSEESMILSSLCHDCCKIDYYIPNYLKSGNLSDSKPYKTEDNFPFGHGEKSAVLAQKYIDLTNQELTLIRWHMGAEDKSWEDYKEKVESTYPEVVLFQHADKEVSLIRKI